jgi:hypothetical protein
MEIAVIMLAVQMIVWIVAVNAMVFLAGFTLRQGLTAVACYVGATIAVNVIGTRLVIALLF